MKYVVQNQFIFKYFLQLGNTQETTARGDRPNNTSSEKTDTIVSLSATEEVDEFIDQNIQINSNKQMRDENLKFWTMKFKDSSKEKKFCDRREDMFRSNMLCVFVIWVFIVMCQAIMNPNCTVLIICLSVSTVLLTIECVFVMAEEFPILPEVLKNSSKTLVHHRNLRTVLVCSVIILMSAMSTIGLFLCPIICPKENCTSVVDPNMAMSSYIAPQSLIEPPQELIFMSSMIETISINDLMLDVKPAAVSASMNTSHDLLTNMTTVDFLDNAVGLNLNDTVTPCVSYIRQNCIHPEYVVFTWVLCLIALATALKLYYLLKTLLAFVMSLCYCLMVLVIFNEYFKYPDEVESYVRSIDTDMTSSIPVAAQMLILIFIFFVMVANHAKLVELTSRLDFIWKERAEHELVNMKSNRQLSDVLIKVSSFIYTDFFLKSKL